MNGPCEEFADRIVDYVDGELPEDEAQAVARHLADCDRAAGPSEAMKRSLGLAKVLWSDNLDDSESTAVPMLCAEIPSHPILRGCGERSGRGLDPRVHRVGPPSSTSRPRFVSRTWSGR